MDGSTDLRRDVPRHRGQGAVAADARQGGQPGTGGRGGRSLRVAVHGRQARLVLRRQRRSPVWIWTGKEVWKFNCPGALRPVSRSNSACTARRSCHDGKLYLQLLHDGGQHVICLDAATGKEIWKVDRPSDGRAECLHSYASPFIWTNGKDAYLVTHGNDYTVAHDLKDGKEIWRLGDLNSEGTVQPDAPICRLAGLHSGPDRRADGQAAALSWRSSRRRRATFEAGSEHELWRRPKGTPDVPSPLVVDGLVYLSGESGRSHLPGRQDGRGEVQPRVPTIPPPGVARLCRWQSPSDRPRRDRLRRQSRAEVRAARHESDEGRPDRLAGRSPTGGFTFAGSRTCTRLGRSRSRCQSPHGAERSKRPTRLGRLLAPHRARL